MEEKIDQWYAGFLAKRVKSADEAELLWRRACPLRGVSVLDGDEARPQRFRKAFEQARGALVDVSVVETPSDVETPLDVGTSG